MVTCVWNCAEAAAVPGVDFHGGAYLVTPTASRYWATVAEPDLTMIELTKLMMPDCC